MKGLPRSLSRGAQAKQKIVTRRLVETVALTVDGATGVGWGTGVIQDLPEGNILLHGAVAYATVTEAHANIVDTWNGDFGVGTTPATDGTITAGDVDIIPSTAIGPAVAGVSPRTRGASTDALGGVVHDNTDGSLELNFNLLVDDADIDADSIPVSAVVELHLTYTVLGDD
jgi:hypothetical protein